MKNKQEQARTSNGKSKSKNKQEQLIEIWIGSVLAREGIYSVGFYSRAEKRVGTKRGLFSPGASQQQG